MTSPVSSPVAGIIFALLAFAILVRLASADTGTSSNFRAAQSVNDFGGSATSTSFQSVTTGGQVVSGTSTSSNFKLDTGFEYSDSFAPKSQNWRWYDDEGSETPSGALEDENVAPINILNGNVVKLRMTVKETAGYGASNMKFKLQHSTSSDFSSGALDVVEKSLCTGSSIWCYENGAGADNDLITTKLLSDSDPCASSVGDGCGTHNESGTTTSSFTHKLNAATEYEFTIVSTSTAANTVYFFRLVDVTSSSSVPVNTGESYPSLASQGGSLSFSIVGLATSTVTGGATTDVSSSPIQVPFGALPFGSPIEAAHRLTVSTNAPAGYEVYVYQSQGFVGSGSEISPVDATNDSPAPWSTSCTIAATGCFGYHTTEAVLAGGSTRFAADDTYAKFTQSLNEVAFSANPASNRSTDVVYKVEVRNGQATDSYTTNVAYIVVPLF